MRELMRSSVGGRGRPRVGIMVGVLCGAILLASATVALAVPTVAMFVYNPTPIGNPNTVPTNHVVSISLAVEDSAGTPIPHAAIYMTFLQASGGGTASVGGVALVQKAAQTSADATGHITISYTTPPTFPSTGCDVVHAQDQPKFRDSHIKKDDSFCFSAISSIGFTPKPVAPSKSLNANSKVTITVSVFGPGGGAYANGVVWLSFRAATGGGAASVGGVALTLDPAEFKTNSLGEVFIAYSTPSKLPTTGSDRLIAADAPRAAAVTASDLYRY